MCCSDNRISFCCLFSFIGESNYMKQELLESIQIILLVLLAIVFGYLMGTKNINESTYGNLNGKECMWLCEKMGE